jgi:flagellar protein FliT
MPEQAQHLLGYYESVGRLSRTRVAAAQSEDWESLAAVERICGLLIERIEAFGDPDAELGPSERRRRLVILRDVLRDDAQVRRITEPSLARFDVRIPQRAQPSQALGRSG